MKTHLLAATAALMFMGSQAIAQEAAAPAETAPAAVTAAPTAASAAADLVATAKSQGQFSTFTKVIEQSGLGAQLASASHYTIFAPTDAAFAKLPAGTLDNLLKPENKAQLEALVKHHVVEGQATAEYFKGQTGQLTSIGGTALALDGKEGVKIGEATVVTADIPASNGVIHAIDTVLTPPAQSAVAPAASAGPAPSK